MNKENSIKLGLSGCGFFSVVIASAAQKSENTEPAD